MGTHLSRDCAEVRKYLGPELTTLVLGVVDTPYTHTPTKAPKKPGKKPRLARGGTQTTGDVAEILEAKYHVMELFVEAHHDDILEAMHKSLEGVSEDILIGAPIAGLNPYAGAEAEIKKLFAKFLESQEIEGMGVPGVPTKAALDGISPRFKSGRGPRRPSFIASALYETDFIAWFE